MSEEEKKAIETLEIEGTENNYLEVKILLNLVEKQQEEIEYQKELYEKLFNGYNERVKEIENSISKDKIRKYFMHEIAFKKRLQREKQKLDKYNRGRFDTIEEILELLEDN